MPIKDKIQEQEAKNAKLKRLTTYYGDFKQRKIFFEQAKAGKKTDKEGKYKVLLKYFINIRDNHDVPEPCFAQSYMNHNTLYLRE